MNCRFGKTRASLLLAVPALLTACAGLHINPPSAEKQSLLLLPVKLEHKAQHRRHGFYYIYEITSDDNSVPSYQAVFKLPVKGDMLIVDSLPPGNYRVSKFIFKPVGSGDFTYGNNVQQRNDRFQLVPGKITIFQNSLNVLTYNKIPGRGMSTSYSFDLQAVTNQQKQEILATLQALENYGGWEIAHNYSPPGSAAIKPSAEIVRLNGNWSGSWQPRLDSANEDSACNSGELGFAIEQAKLRGRGISNFGEEYALSATINNSGVVRGKISFNRRAIAKIMGQTHDDGEIRGSFEFANGCSSEWKALAKSSDNETTPATVVASEWRQLDAAALRRELAGKELRGRFKGNWLSVLLGTDGSISGTVVLPSGKKSSDHGKWQVSDAGLFCDQWRNWQDGNDCDRVYVKGDRIRMVNLDGSRSFSGRIVEPDSSQQAGTVSSEIEPVAVAPVDRKTTTAGEISGTFVSAITSNHPWPFRNRKSRSMRVSLQQKGDRLVASSEGDSGNFLTRRTGDTINFVYTSAAIGYDIVGEWKLLADGNSFQGTWQLPVYEASGKDLTRIE